MFFAQMMLVAMPPYLHDGRLQRVVIMSKLQVVDANCIFLMHAHQVVAGGVYGMALVVPPPSVVHLGAVSIPTKNGIVEMVCRQFWAKRLRVSST